MIATYGAERFCQAILSKTKLAEQPWNHQVLRIGADMVALIEADLPTNHQVFNLHSSQDHLSIHLLVCPKTCLLQ